MSALNHPRLARKLVVLSFRSSEVEHGSPQITPGNLDLRSPTEEYSFVWRPSEWLTRIACPWTEGQEVSRSNEVRVSVVMRGCT